MLYFKFHISSIFLLALCQTGRSFLDTHDGKVRVNKCCEKNEILVDLRCVDANETNQDAWSPIFTGFNGQPNFQVPGFWFAIGIPQCSEKQMWPIYFYPTSRDRLALLPDGRLRHSIQNSEYDDIDAFNPDADKAEESNIMHDYEQGQYCMDKAITTKGTTFPSEFAMVCSPDKNSHWADTDFLLRKVVNPICHGISITILLVVGICYFVVPSLRDLVGNIVTTITCCLIVGQVANLLLIFTEFRNHINFLILDIFAQVSVTATFFWLSSMGYFIWKTFRSRNVFLRVTDGKKYCLYSFYAWGSTLCMASLGIFAHLYLDYKPTKSFVVEEIETIGLLGLSVFFVTNCAAIGFSIYFYISTYNYLSQRLNASYGRIHHKLKSNFVMFALLLLLLTISWVLTLISRIDYEGIFYINLRISAIQAPLVLFICVLRQKHVTYLLQKACCSKQPLSGADWGDEMTYINTAH